MKVDVSAIETQLWPHGSNRDVYMVLDGPEIAGSTRT